MRVGPVVGEALVLRGLTDRGEAKPDERDPGPPCELPSHLLAKDLGQRVGRMGPHWMGLVDRQVVGLRMVSGGGNRIEQVAGMAPAERQAENGLAGSPHDPPDLADLRGAEHVVGAPDVDVEGAFDRPDSGRGNGREMDDGIGAPEGAHGLAEVRQVCPHRLRRPVGGRDDIDVHNIEVVGDEIRHDRSAGLPASACHDDPGHRRAISAGGSTNRGRDGRDVRSRASGGRGRGDGRRATRRTRPAGQRKGAPPRSPAAPQRTAPSTPSVASSTRAECQPSSVSIGPTSAPAAAPKIASSSAPTSSPRRIVSGATSSRSAALAAASLEQVTSRTSASRDA